jgi:hypothetical protein
MPKNPKSRPKVGFLMPAIQLDSTPSLGNAGALLCWVFEVGD